MMYQVMMMNGGAVIAYNGTALFENLKLEVSLTRRVNFTASPVEIKTEKGKTTILFDGKGKMRHLALVLSEKRGVLVLKLEAEVNNYYSLFISGKERQVEKGYKNRGKDRYYSFPFIRKSREKFYGKPKS